MARAATKERLDPAIKRTATVVVLGMIMSILDTTIVVVALDTLRQDFHTSLSTIQWVTTGYLLAIAVVIPASGWAMDRFGARRTWIASLAVFVVGSALCGLAWSATALIAFRVIQGLGGGMIMPVGQAILARAAGPAKMGRVMGVVGVPTILGPVLGPVLGGLIVTYTSWRLIFYVNVPIGILAIVVALAVLPKGEGHTGHRFDGVGFALLAPGLALSVYGLSQVGVSGQTFSTPKVDVLLGIGVALIAGFVVSALRKADPLVDLRLLKDRAFGIANACIFFMGAALYGAMFLLPLYYQIVRGESALVAGLMMCPQGIGAMLMMRRSGAYADRHGARGIAAVGMGISVLGTLVFTQVTATIPLAVLAVAMFVRGLGMGMSMMPITAASYASLSHAQVPRATSITSIMRQVGGSVATAVLAVVLQSAIERNTGLPPSATSGSSSGHPLPPNLAEELARAFGTAFWWALAASAIAIIPVLFLKSRPKLTPASETTVLHHAAAD